jgi:predicted Zn-dependent protease with MMP-like domain
MRLSPRDFDRAVARAVARIPAEIQPHLENVQVTVQKRPARALLDEMGLPPDEPLLGVYLGESLAERSFFEPLHYPDTIVIFQEPLEAMCRSVKELEEQIAITVVHEIAHHLGIDEERVAELGYD